MEQCGVDQVRQLQTDILVDLVNGDEAPDIDSVDAAIEFAAAVWPAAIEQHLTELGAWLDEIERDERGAGAAVPRGEYSDRTQ
jgi:hypothetical protein